MKFRTAEFLIGWKQTIAENIFVSTLAWSQKNTKSGKIRRNKHFAGRMPNQILMKLNQIQQGIRVD